MKRYTLAELSQLTGSLLVGDPSHTISNVDALKTAGLSDASFLANPRYVEAMKISSAGVICVDRKTTLFEGKNFLISDNPSETFQKIAELLIACKQSQTGFKGIHKTAVIHSSVKMGENCTIGPNVVIDADCEIGEGTRIDANTAIAKGTKIGSDCHFYSNVTVREGTQIGHRVILQPGAVIGSCGFGYVTDEKGEHCKLGQIGIVIIEDDVEIGANTTIDRARFKATIIKRGTKIDNLVQIGHNVVVGEDNIIVSQTGIAGSSSTGRHVIIGGQCGITGHVELSSGVQLATRGGVSKSIKKPGPYRGSPAIPLNEYNRQKVHLRRIEKLVKRVEALEKQLKE